MPHMLPPLARPLGFVHNTLDRAHPKRTDAGWLAEQHARKDARFLVLAGDRALYAPQGNPEPSALFDPVEAMRLAPSGEDIFLGFDEDRRPVFARQAPPPDGDGAGPQGADHRDLRSLALQGVVPDAHVSIAALARSLLAWHSSHRYCSACGKPSQMTLGGYRRDCPDCGTQHFPRTDPVVIMLVTDGERALIARSARFVPKMYSAIAGFMEPGETIEQAVAREAIEETGIEIERVAYHMSQPWPFPSSLMIACYAEARTTEIRIDPQEIEDAFWASREELAAAFEGKADFTLPQPIAIAHHLIRDYVSAGL